jgi:exopolysaccharide biosynthesis protein
VTVDGRQRPYSDGMTLRELAEFFLQLGVSAAINLDGGGSTTLVVRDPSGVPRIANRPSDREGERPVANALAVVGGCR